MYTSKSYLLIYDVDNHSFHVHFLQDTDPPCRILNGRVGRRKRDRINTSLDDLMMLVPASKIKQQVGILNSSL
jgi:hypothetical protein